MISIQLSSKQLPGGAHCNQRWHFSAET